MSEVLPGDSGADTLAVFMASSGTTEVANQNSPATPPNTINLRSSHNELLNTEIKHSDTKNSTPPKCRKKYALTSRRQWASGIRLHSPSWETAQPTLSWIPPAVRFYPPSPGELRTWKPQPENWSRTLATGQAPAAIMGNGDLLLQKPNKPQSSPEDGQVAIVSSSLESKKDHPKTGAKTDCALHRIQNLAPSDAESSWTTLSQDNASPSSLDESADIWSDQSFQTDPDLPPGWKRINDIAGTYYWHIPTGTTQWERPVSIPTDIQGSRKRSLSSVMPSPTPENEDLHAATVNPDPSLKEFEEATLRYASLKLRNVHHADDDDSCSINSDPEAKCFTVRSLGWVEMAEEDLAPGKSSVAVNNCIRQLSYCKNDIRDTVGIWGEGKDMYLILENNMLSLVNPMDRTALHSQPIMSIHVWGVGRDNGRDFAYVARDKDTRILKCHVFRCDTPAKVIATSLHEICSKIMAEQKNAKALACSSFQERTSVNPEVPLQVDFPMPKTELVQKFHMQYLGMLPVDKPVGMDILNNAIESLMTSSNKEDWPSVNMNVADATVTVISEKNEEETLVECRV
ncbi:APBB2-like [Ictidomys tridecemlineatus]|uniref:Amyloid beta A4 precursor protein-binding family B member 2 pseudogene n=1 Tax=Ictidomys tridecemlineatus TaxID=43179 RepID=A0A287D007_ICTTR|nr:APBB2-like [Ictidomys tridecemlineatus]